MSSAKEKLLALKNVIDDPSSSAGERDNARRLFDRLIAKYGLKESEIVAEETPYYSEYPFTNEYEFTLLIQIIGIVKNQKAVSYKRPKRAKKVWILTTQAQAREIHKKYQIYRKALGKELDRCVEAFIQANALGIDNPDRKNRELTKEELEELENLLLMARAIKKTQILESRPAFLIGKGEK